MKSALVYEEKREQDAIYSMALRRSMYKYHKPVVVCMFSNVMFRLILYVSDNSYGRVETVSSPYHTFSWAILTKRLTSASCTFVPS